MLQPGTLALVLLMFGAVARAQPGPGLAQRQRSVTVTGRPADPLPEVRGAQGVGITFHFDGPILEESVKVDESRVRVVDVGKRSLLVQPVTAPRADQPTEVSVLYADGEPRRAAFVIVAHPSEVDMWVEVTRRREQADAACQARLDEVRARCGAHSPTAFWRSGLLGEGGIGARTFPRNEASAGGFMSKGGESFLGKEWVLVRVKLLNTTGQPWAPRVATLTAKGGQLVTVRAVTAEPEELAPGQEGDVLVETEVPPPSVGVDFTLEVGGADGRSLQVPNVKLPPRALEEKR